MRVFVIGLDNASVLLLLSSPLHNEVCLSALPSTCSVPCLTLSDHHMISRVTSCTVTCCRIANPSRPIQLDNLIIHTPTLWLGTCLSLGFGHITAGLMESSVEVLRSLHSRLCMESLDRGKKKV